MSARKGEATLFTELRESETVDQRQGDGVRQHLAGVLTPGLNRGLPAGSDELRQGLIPARDSQ